MEELKVLELFGGIGALTKAAKRLGIPYKVVDYVELDKYAVKSYNAMNGTNFEPQDICEWNKDIKVDLIMHGSPCQDFSISGYNKGGDKDSGTRSSLMYETIRIVEKLKPKYVIWENVKNLLSNKHIHNFEAYLTRLRMLGYYSYYQVLDAKDYGIPQNRERVFVVSIRNDVNSYGCHINNYRFPEKQELKLTLKDMLESEVDKKFYLKDELTNTFAFRPKSDNSNVIGDLIMDKWQECIKRVYDINKYAPTLSTMQGGYRKPKILVEDNKIRELTPLECWRLMGFDDEDYNKAAKVNSNTQLYKQAGNSIVVNVLEAVLTNLLLNTEQKR
jgi:DNA (cytosine-5)-methyltransferase 1